LIVTGFNLQNAHCVSYNRHMSESGESKEVKPEVSTTGKKLNIEALKKSLANVQEHGWPAPKKPPEKVSVPPFIKETPPFVEDIPQTPPTRTREQGVALFHNILKDEQRSTRVATFHNILKQDRERQLELENAKNPNTQKEFQPHQPLIDKQAVSASRSENQNKQPLSPYSHQTEQTPPPITENKSIFKRFSTWLSGKS
jgi:hypothetical protein